jgi:uncharacterized protein
MLIDFTVENYRSIKGPVTLSAVAQGRKAGTAPKGKGRPRIKPDHEIAPGYPVEGWGFELLPVLAIFGANASGKSNVVRALDDFLTFVAHGAGAMTVLGSRNFDNFMPFKLDSISSQAPTRFEIRILLEEKIYTYSMELNRERILSEHLEYAKADSKRNRRLFHRDWNEDTKKNEWKNGEDFKGPHTQLEASLKDQEPFINVLHRFEVEVIERLKIWLAFRNYGTSFSDITSLPNIVDMLKNSERDKEKEKIVKIIQQFDTSIADIEVGKYEIKVPVKLSQYLATDDDRLYAYHDTKDGRFRLAFEEESTGTKRLLELAYRISNELSISLANIIIVDELELHLHPHITHAIVKMFQNSETNPNCSQLIFTSHDNTLQRGNLLRRDQIWFTQKRDDQSTELYSLSDFKVRNDLAIDKAYLAGSFGAIPFLPSSL